MSRLPTIRLSGEDEEEVNKIRQEIDLVIRYRVVKIGTMRCLEAEECIFLQRELYAIPNRTYLWVYMILEVLESLPSFTRGQVRRAVKDLPASVDKVYEKILQRSTDPRNARKLLHLILASARPLSLEEISLALAIADGRKSVESITQEQEPIKRFKENVRSMCGLFVTIIDSKLYLLHQTAREFLVRDRSTLSNDSDHSLNWKHSFAPEDSHRILSQVCMTLLKIEGTGKGWETLQEYSKTHWYKHFRKARVDCEDEILGQASELCSPLSKEFKVWSRLAMPAYTSSLFDHISVNESLKVASFLGLNALVRYLLDEGAQLDAADSDGRTALSYAAVKNNQDVVGLLLLRGASVYVKDLEGRTPLSLIMPYAKESIIDQFLEAGADIDSQDNLQRTPLSYAAQEASKLDVALLLVRGATVKSKDKKGISPLSYAAKSREELIVELLLEKGADVTDMDICGSTPLSYAAYGRNTVIIEKLLKKGAKVDSKDKFGWTPLFNAANWYADNEAAIKLLLENGADANSRANTGYSPLFYAVNSVGPKSVQLLLQNGAQVNVYALDGSTPLVEAMKQRTLSEPIIKTLIEAGANADAKEADGWTPLLRAIFRRCWWALRVFLEKGTPIEMSLLDTLNIQSLPLLSGDKVNVGELRDRSIETVSFRDEAELEADLQQGKTALDLRLDCAHMAHDLINQCKGNLENFVALINFPNRSLERASKRLKIDRKSYRAL